MLLQANDRGAETQCLGILAMDEEMDPKITNSELIDTDLLFLNDAHGFSNPRTMRLPTESDPPAHAIAVNQQSQQDVGHSASVCPPRYGPLAFRAARG
ncbi:uncharacterized protein RHO25_012364 [Cercospora beticola]|uniref:Uncharacterized protein n=1 Tax=Cercospora beticola TaxID=122368 RepID=A0ABZ0P725_CERBT|nr:hypothetical protein RHO25_012364 [Cercospora beticola]CAK1356489.1 unnamed protein product [Cercospora beticola]